MKTLPHFLLRYILKGSWISTPDGAPIIISNSTVVQGLIPEGGLFTMLQKSISKKPSRTALKCMNTP